jgi:hypothetical protein
MVGAMHAMDEYEYGVDLEGLAGIADDLPSGGAGMLIVIEHTWAIPLRDALRDSGGIMIAQDFLSPEALITIGALSR